MSINRTDRLNSLLKEVLDEVIRRDLKHRNVHELLTVTRVEITKDLHYAKVYISVIGTDADKEKTLSTLQKMAGYIAVIASKKVVMRYFPSLTFILDDSVDQHMRLTNLMDQINEERRSRESTHPSSEEEQS